MHFRTTDVVEILRMIETGHVNLESIAERMLRDYDALTPGTVFADGLRLSLNAAWRLQEAVAKLRLQRGEQRPREEGASGQHPGIEPGSVRLESLPWRSRLLP